jgi:hypothetical protein
LNDRGVFNLKLRSTPMSEKPINLLRQCMIEMLWGRRRGDGTIVAMNC